MELVPLGDSALLIQVGEEISLETHLRVRAIAAAIEAAELDGVVEVVPAFSAVAVHYDPIRISRGGADRSPFERLRAVVARLSLAASPQAAPLSAPVVEVPVCYGGEFGPDLPALASRAGLSEAAFVEAHAAAEYTVFMIGFSAGFPYLGGLPEKLAAPRHATPRASVPAGSLGIAGRQSGIYPFSTPGGWQLIGRTPLQLFNPTASPPALLTAGTRVRFRAIAESAFRTERAP